jgi:hypothetical protein
MLNDKDLIENLGGSAKVAQELGYTVQRVQNWKDRGIPAKVKLDRPDLFLPGVRLLPQQETEADEMAHST